MVWVRNIGIAALVCVFFPLMANFGFQKSTLQNSYNITKYDSHEELSLKSATNIANSANGYLWPEVGVRFFFEAGSSYDPWDASAARDSSVYILNTDGLEKGIVEPEFNGDSEIWNRPEEPGRIQLSWLGPGSHTLLLFVNPNQDSVLKTYTSRITSSIYETSWYHLLIILGTGMLLYLTFRYNIRSPKTGKEVNDIAPAIQDVKQERDIPPGSEEEKVTVLRSEILELIHDRYTDPSLSVTQIAGILNCSKSALYRKWNKHHEQSISHYVTELRLKKARELIIEKEYTISEIAYMCGFSSQSYFTKVFKKKVGVSPTKYASDKQQ
ncbi:MAG: helix-turn-helix transcriptional regulator [Balneolaceae bacterium]